MNFTPDIFEAFQTKLKVGNRRTIHLNAIPGNSRYKFDLARLATIQKSLPEHFILDLLTLRTVNFKFSIHDKPIKSSEIQSNNDDIYLNEYDDLPAKPKENKKDTELSKEETERQINLQKLASSLENLIFQNEVIQSEKGLNSLGFGFPLLIRRDMNDGQISVAPLLIWSVKIKPSLEMNTWEVSRTEDDPIYLNEVLINHLQTDSGVFLEPIPAEMLEDGKIDKPELLTICQNILNQLKVDQNLDFILNNYEAILPIKNKAAYEKMLPQKGDAIIEKCGLFSLFEVQKQNIINDYGDLIANYKTLENGTFEKKFQSITAVETDPSQQGILESLKKNSKIVIQGPPGTGKSQTLTALLINALENKQKTIVVCEKQTALEVLQAAMQKNKLDRFCIMIKDSVSDRKQVVDAVRNTVDNTQFKNATQVYPQSVLQEQIDSIEASKNEINAVHHKLNEPLLNNQNWAEIIGQQLECLPLKEEIDLLAFPFTFDANEWNGFNDSIEQGAPLYVKFKPYSENLLYNPLQIIKADAFTSQMQINEAFQNYNEVWSEINQIIQRYEAFYYSKRKEELATQLEELEKYSNEMVVLTATLNQNNDEFNNEKTSGFFYKVGSWFSGSKKTVLLNREKLQELGKKIKTISLHRNFYPIEISADLWQNLQEVKKYDEKILLAKQTFSDKIEADFQATDLLNFFERNYQSSDLDTLVSKTKRLKQKIQDDNWLHHWNGGITFQEFKVQLETTLSKHHSYSKHSDNPFLIYYNWFSFYHSLTNFQQQVLQKLFPVAHWKDSFWHAYLNLLLQKNTNNSLNFNEDQYYSITKKIIGFSSSQKNFIESYWKNEQLKAAQHFEKINKEITVANLYNKRKSVKFNRLTLRQIVNTDTDLFTAFFPILFTTPDVCCNLFQGKNFYFDNVVFDEASQLKLEDNLPALLKGKNIIIAGDEHQMPPSNYFSKVFDGSFEDEDDLEEESVITQKNALLNIESLLDFALEYKFDKNHLDFHYRSKHPYLIDFSNHAFYNSRLKPLPAFSNQKPIEFYQVNGTFHEHINEEEAEKVLEILEQIEPNSVGKYPSVGIATFNITQRNLIKRKIAYKQSLEENSAFRQKIIQLEAAGLFIKNLENIQGDERDIIIISTTYGPKRDGKFIQSFGPINHSKGYKLLNVIITRAKEKIYICNSVPEEMYSNYKTALQQEGSNNRRAVFYAYLSYCKAVSEENETKRKEILNDLDGFSTHQNQSENHLKNIFKEQVYKQLTINIPEAEIISNHPFGGYHLDLLIKTTNGKSIAVECLSKENYIGELAYLEDLHKEKILKKAGYDYQRIWSQYWWQNPEREILNWKEKIANN
jgi:hypothetical protein